MNRVLLCIFSVFCLLDISTSQLRVSRSREDSHAISNSTNKLDYQDVFKCIGLRLRELPVPGLNKTRNNELYLNANEGDRLRLIFNTSCDRRIMCTINNRNKEAFRTLTTTGSDIDLYVRPSSQSYVRCFRNSSSENVLLFHLFVQKKDKKFFTDFRISPFNSTGFLVQCIGAFHSENVKLLVNRQPTNATYDPINGFFVRKTEDSNLKFYQCQHENELSSLGMGNKTRQGSDETFRMEKNTYLFQTQLMCIIENVPFALENLEVFLSCPQKSICPELEYRQTGKSQMTFSAFLKKSEMQDEESFHCVFMVDGNVVERAFLQSQSDSSIILYSLFLIGVIVTVIVFTVNKFGRWKYEKIAASDLAVFMFEPSDLELEDSKKIGQGNSSVIRATKLISTEQPVVVKYSKNIEQSMKELKMLKSLSHHNIIKPLGAVILAEKRSCYTRRVQHLVLPYYPEQSLEVFISKYYPVSHVEDGNDTIFFESDKSKGEQEQVTKFELIGFGWQIAKALEYLKEMKITHRDVAMRNVLITNNRACKLADFELAEKGETPKQDFATKMQNFMSIRQGKCVPWLMYPIECMDGAYYYSSEVFCLGRLLLEMFMFNKQAEMPTRKGHLLRLEQTPEKPQFIRETAIYELIVDCMKYNHKERPIINVCESVLRMTAQSISEKKFLELKKKLVKAGVPDPQPLPLPYPPSPLEMDALFTPI